MLGWRYREPYATKSTFITLACKDGADPDVIEARGAVSVTLAQRDRGDRGNRIATSDQMAV
jgi:hypothetical protein